MPASIRLNFVVPKHYGRLIFHVFFVNVVFLQQNEKKTWHHKSSVAKAGVVSAFDGPEYI